jgi:mono/diheme cytochrome c family protein
MKKVLLVFITNLIIVACHTTKKSTTPTPSPAPPPTAVATPSVASAPVVLAKPANGIYEPGAEELKAIQARHSDVTLDKLKQGYVLYAQSACISCHPAQNIYNYDEFKWNMIINDMGYRAKLTTEQKDAVLKYVLAIKSTQPK